MEELYRKIVEEIGENPQRQGLLRTPKRAADAMRFMTSGYHQSLGDILNDAIFEDNYDDMVIANNIEFYSLCEHHLLPFFGKCHIAYIPTQKIIGLSKLARLVDMLSRRLQVQERLTHQIAHTLDEVLKPQGVAVVMEAQHLCMMMRGVEKQNSRAVTSAVLGLFRKDRATRAEFMDLLKISH